MEGGFVRSKRAIGIWFAELLWDNESKFKKNLRNKSIHSITTQNPLVQETIVIKRTKVQQMLEQCSAKEKNIKKLIV